jgi:hypothetical protein
VKSMGPAYCHLPARDGLFESFLHENANNKTISTAVIFGFIIRFFSLYAAK